MIHLTIQHKALLTVKQSTNKPYQCHEEACLLSMVHLDQAWILWAGYSHKVYLLAASERK
jgi:hypothetical protein